MIRLTLCGCGVMGRQHIDGMGKLKVAGRTNFDLAAVCGPLEESAEAGARLAEQNMGRRPETFTMLDEMAANVEVDGVILTLTLDLQVPVGEKAFKLALHLSTGKLITLTVAQGRRLVEGGQETVLCGEQSARSDEPACSLADRRKSYGPPFPDRAEFVCLTAPLISVI